MCEAALMTNLNLLNFTSLLPPCYCHSLIVDSLECTAQGSLDEPVCSCVSFFTRKEVHHGDHRAAPVPVCDRSHARKPSGLSRTGADERLCCVAQVQTGAAVDRTRWTFHHRRSAYHIGASARRRKQSVAASALLRGKAHRDHCLADDSYQRVNCLCLHCLSLDALYPGSHQS